MINTDFTSNQQLKIKQFLSVKMRTRFPQPFNEGRKSFEYVSPTFTSNIFCQEDIPRVSSKIDVEQLRNKYDEIKSNNHSKSPNKFISLTASKLNSRNQSPKPLQTNKFQDDSSSVITHKSELNKSCDMICINCVNKDLAQKHHEKLKQDKQTDQQYLTGILEDQRRKNSYDTIITKQTKNIEKQLLKNEYELHLEKEQQRKAEKKIEQQSLKKMQEEIMEKEKEIKMQLDSYYRKMKNQYTIDIKQQLDEKAKMKKEQREMQMRSREKENSFNIGSEYQTQKFNLFKKEYERHLITTQVQEKLKQKEERKKDIQAKEEMERTLFKMWNIQDQQVISTFNKFQFEEQERKKKFVEQKEFSSQLEQAIKTREKLKERELEEDKQFLKVVKNSDRLSAQREIQEKHYEKFKKQIQQKLLEDQLEQKSKAQQCELEKKKKLDQSIISSNKDYEFLGKRISTPQISSCSNCNYKCSKEQLSSKYK